MSRIKLCLQNAHRNATGGQTGTGGEVDLIDKVYYAIKLIIDSKYSDSIELSYDDATVRNGTTADGFIALHFDGSTNLDYNGGFVDDSPYDLVAAESWRFAQIVADNYFSAMGIEFMPNHRTNNSTYYYAFNFTGSNTKQFLIELGTLTNVSDKAKLQDYNKIAQLLMNGIVSYWGVKQNIAVAPPPIITPPPISPPIDCKVYTDQIQLARDIIWGKWTWIGIRGWKNRLNQLKNILPK